MRHSTFMRAGLSGFALSIAIAASAPAMAQDQTGDLDPTTDASSSDDQGIGVIIVTAQRVEQTLQNAGIPIDAVSGDSLTAQNILSAQDITRLVPSITITNGGGSSTSIFLRGVGNVTTNSYFDPAIVPSYDGVVLGRSTGAFSNAFYDLSRVEVLKGPQGILYGRNATGGAVNIIPNRPEFGEFGAGGNFSYGNFDAVNVDGYINIGIGSNSALRIAGTHQVHDGYNRDGTDDLDRSGVRAQFLIEPTDTLSIRLGGDYTWVRGLGAGGSYIGNFQGDTFIPSGLDDSEGFNTPAANAYRQTVLGAPGFGFLNALNQQQSVDYDYWGVNAEITLETGIGDLTVIPAYRVSDGQSFFYGPAFNTAYSDERDEQFTVEARLAGSAGFVDYVVGGFYFDENIDQVSEYNQEFVLPIQNFTASTESWAAFGQLTANITDQFRLIGGLRYTHDTKAIDGSIINFITFCGGIPPLTPPASFGAGCAVPGNLPRYPNFADARSAYDYLIGTGLIPPIPYQENATQVFPLLSGAGVILKDVSAPTDSGSFSRVTWRVGAEWDVTEENLLYATVESGYRAGGFQLASGNTSYDPEYIIAYTIGSKNRFFDNHLQVNVELFNWHYTDQQINYFTVDNTGVLINANKNVGQSDIRGFDVDVIARPLPNTTLSAKVQYLDTEYNGLELITAPPRDNYNCPVTNTGQTTTQGAPVLSFNCSGRPLLFSPEWTLNFGVEQIVPLGNNLEIVGAVNTAWRDEQFGGFNFLDFQLIHSYWTTGANLTLREADGQWSIAAFVNNIEGHRHIQFPQASPIGFATATYTAPRTYGVRASFDF